MARDFTKSLSNYMSLGVNALSPLLSGAGKVSLHAWVYLDTFDAVVATLIISIKMTDAVVGLGLSIAPDSGLGNVVRCLARAAAAEATRTIDGAAIPVTAGAWFSIGAIIDFSGDTIEIFINGASDGGAQAAAFTATTYTPGTPTTLHDMIGSASAPPLATTSQADGRIAEIAIWLADIGVASFAALYQGALASEIYPTRLAYYHRLVSGGDAGPDLSSVGGLSGVITGSVPLVAGPDVFNSSLRFPDTGRSGISSIPVQGKARIPAL